MSVKHVLQDYLIGADPEAFIVDKNGGFVSAHNLFPGTKQEPVPIAGGAVQVDGVALEVNVTPAKTADEFVVNLFKTLEVTNFMLKQQQPSHEIAFTPTAVFSKEYFDKLPANVKELGCSPDFDAFAGGKENEPPRTTKPMRTGGGHIHVGWTKNESPHEEGHFFDCIVAAKQLSAALYIPSHSWDNDQKRRELYGKIGAFRPKPYGLEIRFLSNAWAKDPRLARWVCDSASFAMQLLDMDQKLYEDKEFTEFYRQNKVPDKKDVKDYMQYLSQYGFDSLPEEYA